MTDSADPIRADVRFESLMDFDAIVFDLDGTLRDTTAPDHTHPSFAALVEALDS